VRWRHESRTIVEDRAVPRHLDLLRPPFGENNRTFSSGETITKFCVELIVDTVSATTIRQFDGYGELRWSGMMDGATHPRPQEGEGAWEVPSHRVRGEFLQVLRWDVRGGSGLFPPWLSWPPLARRQPTYIEVVPLGWFLSTHHQHHRRHPHTAPTPGPRLFKREQTDTTQRAQLRRNSHKPADTNKQHRPAAFLFLFFSASDEATATLELTLRYQPTTATKCQIATKAFVGRKLWRRVG
jgi:hypothetical protein